MLAPQTIQVRYGPTGLLAGSLGALLGRNEAFQRQSGLDQAFINNRLNYAQQQGQEADQMNANRLQQANQTFGPQPSGQPVANPADVAANQAYLTGAAHDISPESQTALSQLAVRPGVKPTEFGGVLASNVANQQKRKTEADANAALSQKRAFLQQAAPGLDPNDVNALAAAVEDPKFSTTQLNLAVSSLRRAQQQKDQLAQKQGLQQEKDQRVAQSKGEVARIETEQHLTAQKMKEVSDRLKVAGLSPNSMTPSQFNPAMSQRPHNSSDFIPDAMTAGLSGLGFNPQVPGIVTGPGNSSSRPDYMEYQKLDAHMKDLAAQRAKAMQTAGGGFTEASPAGDPQAGQLQNDGGTKELTPQVAVQFYQAAGGDPNKARQMAIEQGYKP